MVAQGPDVWPQPTEWQHPYRGSLLIAKTTLFVDGGDKPIIEAGEDGAVHISIPGIDQAWEVIIAPTAFAPVMSAIGNAIGNAT